MDRWFVEFRIGDDGDWLRYGEFDDQGTANLVAGTIRRFVSNGGGVAPALGIAVTLRYTAQAADDAVSGTQIRARINQAGNFVVLLHQETLDDYFASTDETKDDRLFDNLADAEALKDTLSLSTVARVQETTP